jgi:hypothetical protein
VQQAQLVLLDHKVFRVFRASKVILEILVLLGLQDRRVFKALKEILEILGQQAQLVLQVLLARRVSALPLRVLLLT